MSLKVLLGSVFFGVAIVASSYFVIAPRVSDTPSAVIVEDPVGEYTEEQDSDELEEEENEAEDESEDEREDSVVPVTTETAPLPTPATTSGYTMVDVAKHADAVSCWTVIRRGVYDLTDWVSKHPGGEKNILKLCGKDGTALFENQHGGSPKQESALAVYRVGDLVSP